MNAAAQPVLIDDIQPPASMEELLPWVQEYLLPLCQTGSKHVECSYDAEKRVLKFIGEVEVPDPSQEHLLTAIRNITDAFELNDDSLIDGVWHLPKEQRKTHWDVQVEIDNPAQFLEQMPMVYHELFRLQKAQRQEFMEHFDGEEFDLPCANDLRLLAMAGVLKGLGVDRAFLDQHRDAIGRATEEFSSPANSAERTAAEHADILFRDVPDDQKLGMLLHLVQKGKIGSVALEQAMQMASDKPAVGEGRYTGKSKLAPREGSWLE